MNAGSFFFVLGCGKKIPASLATEGTMAVLAAVEKTLNDFEYLFSLMRGREPDNWWILLFLRKTRTFIVHIWIGAVYDGIPQLKFDKNSLMVKSNIVPFYRQLFFSSFVFFLANQTPHCASVNVSSIDENGSEWYVLFARINQSGTVRIPSCQDYSVLFNLDTKLHW